MHLYFQEVFLNFSARIDLLETLTKRRNANLEAVIASKHFVSILREATKIRNRYAHGRYSLTYEGGRYSPTAKKIIHIDTSLFDAKKALKKPSVILMDLPKTLSA